jgi:hypothetical protein
MLFLVVGKTYDVALAMAWLPAVGSGRWGLVASGAWRQVPWVEKVVVGLLRSVTWAAMACSWAAVFEADLARTKYRGGCGLPRPLPMQVWRWHVVVDDLGQPRAHVQTYLVA